MDRVTLFDQTKTSASSSWAWHGHSCPFSEADLEMGPVQYGRYRLKFKHNVGGKGRTVVVGPGFFLIFRGCWEHYHHRNPPFRLVGTKFRSDYPGTPIASTYPYSTVIEHTLRTSSPSNLKCDAKGSTQSVIPVTPTQLNHWKPRSFPSPSTQVRYDRRQVAEDQPDPYPPRTPAPSSMGVPIVPCHSYLRT